VDEASWLAGTDPGPMLEFVAGRAGARKLRLFAAACCRRVWHLLADERARKAVEAAERHAEDRITTGTLGRWTRRAAGVRDRLDDGQGWTAPLLAAHAAVCAVDRDRGLLHTPRVVARAVATAADLRRDSPAWTRAVLAEYATLCRLLRDVVGNPFRPPARLAASVLAWSGSTAVGLARAAYDERRFPSGELDPARLGVLADALDEAGCTDADLLAHLRGPGPHARRCWPVDLLLGRG
jgi:hypothetical protein